MVQRSRHAALVVAAAVVTAIGVVGSAGGASGSSGSGMPGSGSSPPSGGGHAGHGVAVRAGTSTALATAPPPAELRATLEELLGEHAYLAVQLMRAKQSGGKDFADAADAALVKNTDQLRDAVRAVYGPDAANVFRQQWFDHTQSFFLYASALESKDTAGAQQARDRLEAYRGQFAQLLQSASGGRLPAPAVADNLKMHIEEILAQADAYQSGDYARAYSLERTAYAHMFTTGKTLAGGFSTVSAAELPAVMDAPRNRLRSTLGALLGEHVELAVQAMRAGVTGAVDFPQAAAALDANTKELTGAVEGLFGGPGSRRFGRLWSDHIDAFVAYTVAVARKDTGGKQLARARLDLFEPQLATFLSGATKNRVAAAAVRSGLAMHNEQLRRQIDSYAAGDYAKAYAASDEAYHHMFVMAKSLSDAVGASAVLPSGGAQTGLGGMAGR